MATYVNDLRLKEIATGDEAGTWGTSTNTNLELIGEALGYGTQDCFASDADATTTVADGASDPARAMYFKVTSSATLTATRTLTIAPNTISRVMLIENATTGSQSITISQGSGSTVTIASGAVKMVYLDGAGAGGAVVEALADLELPTVTVADLTATTADINGGTIDGTVIGGTTPAAVTTSSLVATTADINAGTIDGTVIGGSTAAAITGTTITGTSFVSSGDMTFGDDDKAIFGAGSDLQIYHSSSTNDSIIDEAGTGNLNLQGTNVVIKTSGGSATQAEFFAGDANRFYYNNNLKLATTATGIDVTGTAVTDGLTVAGNVSVDGGTIKLDGNYPVGTGNVALGDAALNGSITGTYNTALGDFSMQPMTSGASNTGVGGSALRFVTSGSYNTAVGHQSLHDNTTADNNTAVGYQSLYANTTAANNTAVGYAALTANTTGTQNVAVGSQSLLAHTTGNYNVAVGQNALVSNTTASDNTSVGAFSLDANTTGANNTAVGKEALGSNTTASNNTAVGYQAAYSNTTGNNSVFVGYQAGYNNTTGAQNVAIGDRPMFSGAVSGSFNNAVGAFALRYLTSGSNNVAIGNEALQANTTASNNTAVGYQSLYANTTGAFNTAMGGLALNQATTAAANTCIGYGSGQSLSTGGDNVFVGYLAGQYGISASTGVNNVIVGAYSRLSAVDGNEQIVLGRNIVSGGNSTFRVGAGANTATIAINGSATAFTAASDVRLKENILDSSVGLNFINDLRPVTYTWKAKQDVPTDMSQYEENSSEPCRGFGQTNYGFVAQEVKAVIEKHNLVAGQNIHRVDPDGTNELAPGELVPMLVKAIQELTTQLDAALARITTLEGA
jgi:trimeric autotransporter adhesin